MSRIVAFAAILLASTAAVAQERPINPSGNTLPQPVPPVSTIPEPRDIDYPGTIQLEVDATDIQRAIFRVKERIPVAQAGRMTLLMPNWLPGKHAGRGEVEKLAGLTIRAGNRVLPWRRDPVDVRAFHIDVPSGAREIEAQFQFLTATKKDQGRIVVTRDMMNLQWEAVSLYPAGYFTRRIPIQASVRYPDGWTAASGLPATNRGSTYSYQRTSYETLVDSPVFAGRHYRKFPLTDRVELNVFADTPAELAATPEQIAAHARLVEQSVKLFGTQHYDRYQFLLSISDEMGGIGLEHHRSSENGVGLGYFTKWNEGPGPRNLLPHEFVHSWDGKHLRGADSWIPDFRQPMRNSLLWVYEGQTQFWGYVLQARSGIVSKEDTLGAYAYIAATLDNRPGREWRPLVDTTNDPIITPRSPKGWVSQQRSEDYYNEGLLIWMEVDSILRAQTGGQRSMDDFARAFFGRKDGDWGAVLYTLDDVVATLQGIAPYDWAGFLNQRVEQTSQRAPLAGFTNNGYRVVYTAESTLYFRDNEKRRSMTDLSFSLGLTTNSGGSITSVIWDGPGYAAGLATDDRIVAVNGGTYSSERLKAAVAAAKGSRDPIRLTIESENTVREVAIPYHDGHRYPRLEKTGTGETGLDRLLTAR